MKKYIFVNTRVPKLPIRIAVFRIIVNPLTLKGPKFPKYPKFDKFI